MTQLICSSSFQCFVAYAKEKPNNKLYLIESVFVFKDAFAALNIATLGMNLLI